MRFFQGTRFRTKLVVVTMLTVVAALLIAGPTLFWYERADLRAKLERDLATLTQVIGANSAAAISFGDRRSATDILAALRVEPQILRACIFDRNGRAFATFSRPRRTLSFPASPGPDGYVRTGDQLTYFGPIVDDHDHQRIGTLYFEADLDALHRWLVSYANLLGLVLTVSCIVAFALSGILQPYLTRPLVKLLRATKQVSTRRDYSLRVPCETADEFGELAAGFNEMLAQIETRDATLERNVVLRTAQLSDANEALLREFAQKDRAEAEIRQLNAGLEQRVRDRTAALETANGELEAFTYTVSHDLRAPLRSINGFSQILLDRCAAQLTPDGKRMLNIVSSEAQRMGRLIDDLLAFSRLGRQQLATRDIDMTQLAREAFASEISAAPAATICFDLKPLPPARADPALLSQVFVNLISNAVKYSGKNAAPVIEIGGWSEGGELTYYVKDNGVGFDEKYRHKLFGVFQRLHSASEFQGTGVGLAIVHRVVQRHGGQVRAESKLGEGATFYFTLPCETS